MVGSSRFSSKINLLSTHLSSTGLPIVHSYTVVRAKSEWNQMYKCFKLLLAFLLRSIAILNIAYFLWEPVATLSSLNISYFLWEPVATLSSLNISYILWEPVATLSSLNISYFLWEPVATLSSLNISYILWGPVATLSSLNISYFCQDL